jgi:hypothetical protein
VPLLDAVHDRAHPVGDDRAWSESYYFNGYSPAVDAGFFTRIGIRPNEATIDGIVWLWLPGGGSAALRWEQEQTSMIDTAIDVGGLRYEMVDALRRWRIAASGALADGRSLSLSLAFDALTPAIGVDGTGSGPGRADGDRARAAARHAVAAGHLEQAGRWTGEIRLDATAHVIDGALGNRDKSWGPRRMGQADAEPGEAREAGEAAGEAGAGSAFEGWRWFSVNLDEATHFGGVRILTAAGDLHRGWVWRAGEATSVREWDLTTAVAADGITHEALDLVVRDKRGREHALHGDVLRSERLGADARGCVVEALTRWSHDGRVGYGISEYAHVLDGSGSPRRRVT